MHPVTRVLPERGLKGFPPWWHGPFGVLVGKFMKLSTRKHIPQRYK